MTRTVRGFIRRESGTSLIEAAIITPLLFLLTFAIVDFGALFYTYLALENGVGQATRYAVTGNQMDDPDAPGSQLSREASIKKRMREVTPNITIPDGAFTFSHRVPGGAAWVAGIGGPNDVERVTVRYTWSAMTPLMRPFFENGELLLQVESAMKNEGRFN